MTPLRDRSWCHTVAYASTILAGGGASRGRSREATAQDSSPIVETLALRPQIAELAGAAPGRAADPRGRARRRSRHGPRARAQDRGGRAHRRDRPAARVAPPRAPGRLRRRTRRDWCCSPPIRGRRAGATTGWRARRARPQRSASPPWPSAARRRCGPPGRRRAPRTADRRHRRRRAAAGAVALQLLTLELAHLVGTNPDLIRREQRAYREAAAVAETRADW